MADSPTADHGVLRGFTEEVQKQTAAARALTEEFRSLLVSVRNAVDDISLSDVHERAAPEVGQDVLAFVTEAAREVANATVAVIEGGEPGSVNKPLAMLSQPAVSASLRPAKDLLARRIVFDAAADVIGRLKLSDESVKVLMKMGILGLRGTLDHEVDQVTNRLSSAP